MKISLVGIAGVPLGIHRVKDPRLDQADKLVEADKKVHTHVDVVGENGALARIYREKGSRVLALIDYQGDAQ